jgi:hypothetical protein
MACKRLKKRSGKIYISKTMLTGKGRKVLGARRIVSICRKP